MLNDEKINNKIKAFDLDYQNQNNYVYAVFSANIRKKRFWPLYIFTLIIIIIVAFYDVDTILVGAIIGGIVGGILSLSNESTIIIPKDDGIEIYKFNPMQTKIINKKQIEYKDIEIIKYKKTSFWNKIKLKIEGNIEKIIISDKTVGLKNQTENTKRLIEKMTKKKEELK